MQQGRLMSLTRITSKQTTAAAMERLCKAFRERGVRYQRTIGYKGGDQPSASLDAIEELGVWMSCSKMEEKKKYWCAFGTLPLPDAGSVSITVEINPPFTGMDRQLAGLFAADGAGVQYLCHTGGIGGGKKGVGLHSFLDWFDRKRVPVIDPDGSSTLAFPVAQIGSARMVEHVAEYVLAIADFKAGHSARRTAKTTPPFGGAGEEFEGSKGVSARPGYVVSCDHGIIRNRLADLIAATGRTVSRDQQRDLLVGDSDPLEVEFEIKTCADLQSVYTAVGQLLLHNAVRPVKRRVAVLPGNLTPQMRKAVDSLDIHIVTYRWTKTQIHFGGLDRIIPEAGGAAPINQRK